jgi:hypothetical protein
MYCARGARVACGSPDRPALAEPAVFEHLFRECGLSAGNSGRSIGFERSTTANGATELA